MIISAIVILADLLTEKGQHEDAIVANSQLVCITEIIPGREVIILKNRHTVVYDVATQQQH